MKENSFSDLKIWITGANRGIGRAIADKLSDCDATLYLSSRNISKSNFTESYHKENISYLPCDVSSIEEVKTTYKEISESSGGLDILINNAGVGYFNDFDKITDNQFESMMNINIKGTYYCSKAVIGDMITAGGGMIINILSVAATTVFNGSSIYSATKAAILMMDRVLRNEVRKYGIKIIDILPGATDTELWNLESRTEFAHKMMMPEDIAGVVTDVISLNMNKRLLVEEIVIRPQTVDL